VNTKNLSLNLSLKFPTNAPSAIVIGIFYGPSSGQFFDVGLMTGVGFFLPDFIRVQCYDHHSLQFSRKVLILFSAHIAVCCVKKSKYFISKIFPKS
jgi:Na+/H+ antiporter NhaA